MALRVREREREAALIVDERLSPVVALYVQIDVLYEHTRDPCQPSPSSELCSRHAVRSNARTHQYPLLSLLLFKKRIYILRFLIAGKRVSRAATRRRFVSYPSLRPDKTEYSVSFFVPSAAEAVAPHSRGIISLALYSQHAYLLEVRVTATPAAPRRSAIELMMLGPRRFNNKPHYLQSALGSITTGSVSDSPGPPFFRPPFILPPSRRRRRRRLALPRRKCARY